jgi:hypothetical protein
MYVFEGSMVLASGAAAYVFILGAGASPDGAGQLLVAALVFDAGVVATDSSSSPPHARASATSAIGTARSSRPRFIPR